MAEHSQACFDVFSKRCVCPIENREARVRAAAPEMLALLREFLSIDMKPMSAYRRCASCMGIAAHAEGCRLAALLSRLDAAAAASSDGGT